MGVAFVRFAIWSPEQSLSESKRAKLFAAEAEFIGSIRNGPDGAVVPIDQIFAEEFVA